MGKTHHLLASMMGVESLDTQAQVQHEDLPEASEEVTELKTQIALAEATTDVKESEALVEEFIKEEQSKAAAIEELQECVNGVEGLFAGEFSYKAYTVLMKQADRAAKRAGVELPVSVEGCESMTSASIYLQTRAGLEGFMDTVKQKMGDVKKFLIALYNSIMEWLKSKFGLANKRGTQIAALKQAFKSGKTRYNDPNYGKAEDASSSDQKLLDGPKGSPGMLALPHRKDNTPKYEFSKIQLGPWNRVLDVENYGVPNSRSYIKLVDMIDSLEDLKMRDLVLGDHNKAVSTLRSFSSSATAVRGDNITKDVNGVKCVIKTTELGAFDLTITIPDSSNHYDDLAAISKAVSVISSKRELVNESAKTEGTTDIIYKTEDAVLQMLDKLADVNDDISKRYKEQISRLNSERDFIVSGLEEGTSAGIRAMVTKVSEAKRSIANDVNQVINNVLIAHIECIKAHVK